MTTSLDYAVSEHDLGAAPRRIVTAGRDRSLAAVVGGSATCEIASLRELLGLDGALDDVAISGSLKEIGRFADPHSRLQAAFDSTLGHWLALHVSDLASALAQVIAVSPRHDT